MFEALRRQVFGSSAPTSEVEIWHGQCKLTPDIWKLEQFMFQPIFIPDEMKLGKKQHDLIKEASYSDGPLHPEVYTSEKFTFWKKDLGVESFPIAMEYPYRPSGYCRVQPVPARIQGELYQIRPSQIIKLDIHRQNGVQFRRVKKDILVPYREVRYSKERPDPKLSEERIYPLQAWMYVGIPEYWDDMIGDMFTIRELNHFAHETPKKWIDDFYKF